MPTLEKYSAKGSLRKTGTLQFYGVAAGAKCNVIGRLRSPIQSEETLAQLVHLSYVQMSIRGVI